MADLVTLGEALFGFIGTNPRSIDSTDRWLSAVVGAETNVAIGVSRLGHQTAFIGRVGDDGLGRSIARNLLADRVDISGLIVDREASTGTLIRNLRPIGSAEVIYHRKGSAGSRVGVSDIDSEQIESARWLHVSGITPALSESASAAVYRAVDIAVDHGVTVSLDVNHRSSLWDAGSAVETLLPLIARSDVVMATSDEVGMLVGTDTTDPALLAQSLRGLGCGTGIVKLGADGAVACDRSQNMIASRGIPVPSPADTVGAGDAFDAGFIAASLDDADVSEALRWGNAAGAISITGIGDTYASPTRNELLRLLEDAPDTLR